MSSYKIVIFL